MPGRGRPSTRARGAAAEEMAAAFLERHGLILLHRNYRWRGGEVDLIAQDGTTLCFVEVRSRSRQDYGPALCTVNRQKRARIGLAATHYLACCWWGGPCPCRFDVVAVEGGRITWLRDAFQLERA